MYNEEMSRRGRPVTKITLSEAERNELEGLLKRRRVSSADASRARLILMAAEGVSNQQIGKVLRLSEPTVCKWRARFVKHRLNGLSEIPRPGAPRRITDEQVEELIRVTLESKPVNATHWSTRLMAERCGLSRQSISRVWRAFGLKPHRTESFTLSTDPYFVDKVRDVVGLYLDPPENALVFCVDEKTQVQALDRSQPVLPLRPGQPERQTHDYYRHGTLTLFAALEVATGKIISSIQARHRTKEFLDFLKQIERNVPSDRQIHVILDNYATHKAEPVEDWLIKHPRWRLHFTPTHSSWLNQVERFFSTITTRWIRRGVFRSVPALKTALETYIDDHNTHPTPFRWTATADLILGKVGINCKRMQPKVE